MVRVDVKDRKILYHLDENARLSNTQIARRVGLSKDAVQYRIKKLVRQGTIRRFYTALNTLALGFIHFNTFFRLAHVTPQVKQDFIHFCRKEPGMIWCVASYGTWDFSASFIAKTPQEYQDLIDKITDNFGVAIDERSMALMLDSPTYSRTYLLGQHEGSELQYTPAEIHHLDDTEHNLLVELSQNARESVVKLAESLGTTIDVVRYRMKKLERQGIIQAYRVAINVEHLNQRYYKLLLAVSNITTTKERQLKQYCKEHPHIVQFTKYAGPWEVQIEIEISPSKIRQLMEEIRNEFSDLIKNYILLELSEEKLNYFPFASL